MGIALPQWLTVSLKLATFLLTDLSEPSGRHPRNLLSIKLD
jgi:hypothetical protein